jgi:hypothetical protein
MQHYLLRRTFASAAGSFPQTLDQLQSKVKTCLTIEGGLAQDSHPSLNDKAYLERRNMITNISASYDLVSSAQIPEIDYTKEERQIWHTLFDELSEAQDKYAPLQIA